MLYATYILGAFSSITRSFTDMKAPKVSRDFGFGRFGTREIWERNSGLHLWRGLAQLSLSVPTETTGYLSRAFSTTLTLGFCDSYGVKWKNAKSWPRKATVSFGIARLQCPQPTKLHEKRCGDHSLSCALENTQESVCALTCHLSLVYAYQVALGTCDDDAIMYGPM